LNNILKNIQIPRYVIADCHYKSNFWKIPKYIKIVSVIILPSIVAMKIEKQAQQPSQAIDFHVEIYSLLLKDHFLFI